MNKCMNMTIKHVRSNLLLILTIAGVILGVCLGFAVRPTKPSSDAIMWIGFPGHLYLRLLKMMIVPLIITSVVTGTASLDPRVNGKISMVSFLYVFTTNTLGAILGVVAFILFKPGSDGSNHATSANANNTTAMETQDVFADLLRNIVPDNLFSATFSQAQTKYSTEYVQRIVNNDTIKVEMLKKTIENVNGANLLGLIFACTVAGIAASRLDKKGRPLIKFFESACHVVIRIIRWFLWATPIGVLSLIMVAIADIKDLEAVFRDLGLFIAAVTCTLVVQQLIILPIVLFVLTRRNPFKHLLAIIKAWLVAFASTSSMAALPDMLNACELKLGVDKRVARFVIPFCITINANGSAVFIACSCLFVTNMAAMPITTVRYLIVGLLSAVSALAIPAVPSSSIVTIIMILTSLNVPLDAIALILTVEFFLDRLRTSTNAISHTMAAVVTQHFCRDDLKSTDMKYEKVEIDVVINQELNILPNQDNVQHL